MPSLRGRRRDERSLLLDQLAEARIEEAIAAGSFDELPGAGHPLELDDDGLVPEELRAAYRVLKRAGYVPPEVEARKEISSLVALIRTLDDGPERRRALAKLAFIQTRLDARGCGWARMRRKRAAR